MKAWFRRVGSRNEPKASSKTTVKLESAPTKETASIPVNHVQEPATASGSPIRSKTDAHSRQRIDEGLRRLLQDRGYEEHLRDRGWVYSYKSLKSLSETDLNWTLGQACYLGHVDVVSELLARGVSPSEPSEFTKAPLRGGSKPLHIAVHGRRPNIIKLLAAKDADLNTQDEVGRAPVHYADREDIVEVLLQCGAEINARDDSGDTPLHVAARDGRGAALEALLANGADLNDRSASGLTAMWLIPLKNPEILDHLMRGGADILSTRDPEGRTLLHLAARKGTSDFVRGLLDRGADIESLDPEGRTPLFHAILGARHANITALLERGANLDVRDTHGSTPIQLAQARDMAYTAGMLRQHQVGASARTLDPTCSNWWHYQPSDHRSKYERDTGLTDPMILRWD